MILEEYLADTQTTWSEFCVDPYGPFSKAQPPAAVYCDRKKGYFLFDVSLVRSVLVEGDNFRKQFSPALHLSPKAVEFFSRWVFFREDRERDDIKRQLFKAVATAEIHTATSWSLPQKPLDELFVAIRRSIFGSIADVFFELSEHEKDELFESAEAIFASFQGDRQREDVDIDLHIDILRRTFDRPKRFEFDQAFFDGAVLNSLVDGYEPLNDAVWNTVNVLVTRSGLDANTGYRIAIGLLPSFRYVVRHCDTPVDFGSGIVVANKVYCFLSAQILNYSRSSASDEILSFGKGRHFCAGRGLADALVPRIADAIRGNLLAAGVNDLRLERSDGLGAEGVSGVTFSLKQTTNDQVGT